MLSSIHPLGERARNNRWSTTVAWYVAGSVAGGAVLGAGAGSVGLAVAPAGTLAAAVAAVLAVAAAAHEIGALPVRLPGPRRQVDEDWLHRYRGWVYGLGFGFQLGLGVTTIVTTAAVPLTVALAFLTGSPGGGALVGATFGLARAVPVVGMRRVTTPETLRARHRRLADGQRRVRTGSAALLGAVAAGLAVAGVAGAAGA